MDGSYPNGIRINCFASKYSQIAQQALFDANEFYKQMEKLNFRDEEIYDINPKFEKEVLVSVVFSAMAIEAFVNDYAAACFGDQFFLENIDRLSALSKLQLISKILFHKELDKGKTLYATIKDVFRMRDRYVHNKSSSFDSSILSDCSFPADVDYTQFTSEKEIKKDFADAVKGVKAVYLLGDFFDSNDSKIYSFIRLGLYNELNDQIIEDYIKQVAILLGRKHK